MQLRLPPGWPGPKGYGKGLFGSDDVVEQARRARLKDGAKVRSEAPAPHLDEV